MLMVRPAIHPMILAAAAAVMVFSLLGAATLTGVLPFAASKSDEQPQAPKAKPSTSEAKPATAARPAPIAQAKCDQCGVLKSVQAVEVKGDTSGAGAVLGGVAGAVVGNQFGRGDTRTVLTVAGAAGGALAGNEVEKYAKRHTVYRVTIRMDDGTTRTLSQSAAPSVAIGERVKINGVSIERA